MGSTGQEERKEAAAHLIEGDLLELHSGKEGQVQLLEKTQQPEQE